MFTPLAFNKESIVTRGLVFAVDAADRSSYSPGSGVWKDLTGNGNDGTLVNGPAFDSRNGGSIVFDEANDYVLGNSNLGISGNAEFTIGYWAYWDDNNFSSNYPSGFGGNATNSTGRNLSTTWRSGRIALDYWNNRFRADDALDVRTWYYVTFTKIPGLNTSTYTKLYANSTELSGKTETANTTPDIIDSPFVIGRLDNTRWFKGKIPHIQVYNRALTPSENTQNYNALKSRFGL